MDVVVTSEARARHPRASVQESADQGVAPLNIPENDTDSPKSGSLTLDMALLGTQRSLPAVLSSGMFYVRLPRNQ